MNFLISIIGWFLWNWAEFSITKEKDEDTGKFTSFREYARSHYETWVGSFVSIFALMIIGYRQLDINPIGLLIGVDAGSGWNDLYLFGAGAAWDIVIFFFKYFKNKLSK